MVKVDMPFSKCLNPRKIVNPYTHETIIVPCGHCKSCLVQKQSRLSLQCDLESSVSKFTVFVTLTYANRFVPRMRAVLQSSIDPADPDPFPKYDLYDVETAEVLHSVRAYHDHIEKLKEKAYLFGDIPYLRKSDLQKFMKRLRYHISKQTNEKIRYYACGEYGPVHFRPHFHLLLFINDVRTLQILDELVRSCWQFGRVDCQLSKGSANQYVSSYVNSSCSLPEILTLDAFKPFSLHSFFLGMGFFKSQREKIYASTAEDFIKQSFGIDGNFTEFNLWRSAYRVFYPKCKGYANKSTCSRTYSYSIYKEARKFFPSESMIDIARSVATELFVFKNCFVNGSHHDPARLKFFRYFQSDLPPCESTEDLSFQRFVYSIYVQLGLSRHFLSFCCSDDWSTYSIQRMVSRIEKFYSELDYMHLTDWYLSQSSYFETDLANEGDTVYFYDNVPFEFKDYKELPIYRLYDAHVHKTFSDRIKHKTLNDMNQIFFDNPIEVLQ